MKKKLNDDSRGVAVGTAIIIVVMVIVFGTVFYWMWSMDMLFLPSFVEEWIGLDDDSDELPWDLGTLSALVKSGKDADGETVTFDITYENLRSALLAEEPCEGIYLSAKVNYYADGEPSTRRIVYYRDGERFRVELYPIERADEMTAPGLETLKVADSDTLFVYDRASGESRLLARDGKISSESEAGIPSVNALLEAVAAFPENDTTIADENADSDTAETGNITDTVIKLVRTDEGNVYYIAYTYADLALREEYYVSLDYRMIISMVSRQNGTAIYSYTMTSFSVDPEDYTDNSLYEMSEST